MALNPNIPLGARGPRLSLTPLLQGIEFADRRKRRKKENRLLDLQIDRAETEAKEFEENTDIRRFRNSSERDQLRIRSLVAGAVEIAPNLDSGDIPGALVKLGERKAALERANIPTNDTDAFIELLQTDPQTAIKQVSSVLQIGERVGILKSSQQTSTDQFVDIKDKQGNVIAQRNTITNRVVADPRSQKGKGAEKITGTQRVAAGFASRTEQANEVIDEVGGQFTGVTSRGAGLLPQGLKSSDRQRFEQAERNFVNAILRRESGAAISATEFDSATIQYFPRPGDSKEVLAQKKRNRITVQKSLELEAGPAFKQLKSSLPKTTVNIRGKDVAVGSIVTNARGQRGRVEQDGSITVLP